MSERYWGPDALLKLILIWLAITFITAWVPLIRGAFDGPSYQWATSYFGQRFSGSGIQGNYWLLIVKTAIGVLLLFLGWRGAGPVFVCLALAWQGLGLADAVYSALTRPAQYRFRGDTLGVDVSLAWLGPLLYGIFITLTIFWAVRRSRTARRLEVARWSRRNTSWLLGLAVLLPAQFGLLRLGEPHGRADPLGVLITIGQWLLLGVALRPRARANASPESIGTGRLASA